MEAKSLGDAIRQSRFAIGISLRDFAKQVGVSAPFISDVELGRRFPSGEVLSTIAQILKIDVVELEQYDHRESVVELRRLLEGDPALGMAFKSAMSDFKRGRISSGDLAKRFAGKR